MIRAISAYYSNHTRAQTRIRMGSRGIDSRERPNYGSKVGANGYEQQRDENRMAQEKFCS